MKFLILLGALPVATLFLAITLSMGLWGLMLSAAPGVIGATGLAMFFLALAGVFIGLNVIRLLWLAVWEA